LREVWFKLRFKLFRNSEAEWWYKVNQNRVNHGLVQRDNLYLRPSRGKFAPIQQPERFVEIDEESVERIFFDKADKILDSESSDDVADERLLDIADELATMLELKKLADSKIDESFNSYFDAMKEFGY
jgi:hypothetical protein